MDHLMLPPDVQLDVTIEKAKDWALLNGLTVRSRPEKLDSVEFIPFVLLPSLFPRHEYEEVRSLQPIVNQLVHRVAQDGEFLRTTLAECARTDNFTKQLLDIYLLTRIESCVQPISLGLLRADYMLCEGGQNESKDDVVQSSRCKQIEVNTIASGQGWIGSTCTRLHCYLLKELDLSQSLDNLPENNALDGLCAGIIKAWKIYTNTRMTDDAKRMEPDLLLPQSPKPAVLFVVEDATTLHISDQRHLEYHLRRSEPELRVLRLSLEQLSKRLQLQGTERRLLVDEVEIAVVYFRSGYSPENYSNESTWIVRYQIERSKAIKCPTIGYQLAGTKKVQQILAQPGVLERFLIPEDSMKMRRFFTGLYSLDFDEAGETAVAMALERPEDFVLKPQREGGANNLFGEELQVKLKSMSSERSAWILMDRIAPVVQQNYFVKPGGEPVPSLEDVTSELGIFGVVLGDEDGILMNESVGHTLRTKFARCNEGGVSSGFGACDSPFLV